MSIEGKSLKGQILKGTFILAAAGIITRILGLYNRVFLAGLIGAAQLGIYQLIFPVFSVCNAICCSGIETALSRLCAKNGGQGKWGDVRKLVKLAVGISLFIAVILAFFLYFFADQVSLWILKEPECAKCLQVLSAVLVLSTAHSCILGYFYGMKKTAVPAISQLIEQVSRVGAIWLLSVSLFSENIPGAVLAVLGMAAGDFAACIFTLSSYAVHDRMILKKKAGKSSKSYAILFGNLMNDAVPLTANRLSLTMLQSIEAILIPAMLRIYYGDGARSLEVYGILTGMAMPFLMFPTTITNALSSMLLPAVAEAAGRRDYAIVKRTISQSVHYCMMLGILGTAAFYMYGNQLGIIFFKNEEAGAILVKFAVICPLLYMSSALASVLNGLGKMKSTLLHNVLSLGIRIGFIVVLVAKTGIDGYLWGLLSGSILLCLLHILKIKKECGFSFRPVKTLILPILSVLCAGFVSQEIYGWMMENWSLPPLVLTGGAGITLALVYGVSLWLWDGLELIFRKMSAIMG